MRRHLTTLHCKELLPNASFQETPGRNEGKKALFENALKLPFRNYHYYPSMSKILQANNDYKICQYLAFFMI